jgi:DNA-binding NtrC family response regulator
MNPPDPPHRFLVIDDNADSRTLLTKTLLRKYPESLIHECQTGDTAIAAARTDRLNAVIAHRTFEYDGETLIRLLRRANPTVPLIMVSGYDRREAAKAAGADAFMNYDAWLTIGNVVAEAMAARARTREEPRAPDVDKDALGEPEMV